MKKWIIIASVVVLFVNGVLVYKHYFAKLKTDRFSSNNQGFSYSGSSGNFSVNYQDPADVDFGLPIYPGAKPAYDQSVGEVIVGSQRLLMGSYITSDSKQQVINYYKSQITNPIIGTLEDQTEQTIIKSSTGASVNISSQNSSTQIVLVKPI